VPGDKTYPINVLLNFSIASNKKNDSVHLYLGEGKQTKTNCKSHKLYGWIDRTRISAKTYLYFNELFT